MKWAWESSRLVADQTIEYLGALYKSRKTVVKTAAGAAMACLLAAVVAGGFSDQVGVFTIDGLKTVAPVAAPREIAGPHQMEQPAHGKTLPGRPVRRTHGRGHISAPLRNPIP